MPNLEPDSAVVEHEGAVAAFAAWHLQRFHHAWPERVTSGPRDWWIEGWLEAHRKKHKWNHPQSGEQEKCKRCGVHMWDARETPCKGAK